MAMFGKKTDGKGGDDATDFLRIPTGTRLTAAADGKLALSFDGDMSFGESLPLVSELSCGRNLSLDPGVVLRADSVKVKAALELGPGAKLFTRRLEVESLTADRAVIQVREVVSSRIEVNDTQLTADTVAARESIVLNRGEIEIGTVRTPNLTVTKGTRSHILITQADKVDGQVTKGGYPNYEDFLALTYLYHPEMLSPEARAEGQRLVGEDRARLKVLRDTLGTAITQANATVAATPTAPAATEPPSIHAEVSADLVREAAPARLSDLVVRARAAYQGREVPREVQELAGLVEAGSGSELRRMLTPLYQRLSAQGKIPEPVMEVFIELQRMLKDEARNRKEIATA